MTRPCRGTGTGHVLIVGRRSNLHDSSMPRDGYWSHGLAMLTSRESTDPLTAVKGRAPSLKRRERSACQSGYKYSKYRNVSRCRTRGEPKVPVRLQIQQI